LPHDLRLNAAWARALGRAGLLAEADVARIAAALEAIGRELSPAAAARATPRTCTPWSRPS